MTRGQAFAMKVPDQAQSACLMLSVDCTPHRVDGLAPSETVTTDPPTFAGVTTVRRILDGPVCISAGTACACADDGTWALPANEDVALRAAPCASNAQVGWEGGCDAIPQRYDRTFQEGDTVTARFAPHALRLSVSGDGGGALANQGSGIDADGDADCGGELARPPQFAITVFGSEGTTLGAWSGACGEAPRDDHCSVLVLGSTDLRTRWARPWPPMIPITRSTGRRGSSFPQPMGFCGIMGIRTATQRPVATVTITGVA